MTGWTIAPAIHLRFFNAGHWNPSAEEIERWLVAVTDGKERIRIQRFRHLIDAKLSLAGRILMHSVVSEFSNCPAAGVRFSRTESNRPILVSV